MITLKVIILLKTQVFTTCINKSGSSNQIATSQARGLARLFKMRAGKGAQGANQNSKCWLSIIDPVQSVISFEGAGGGGRASDWGGGSFPLTPPGYVLATGHSETLMF